MFTIFFAIALVCLVVRIIFSGINVKVGRNASLILIWFAWSCFSMLCGWLYFRNVTEWQNASVSYLSRVLMYVLFALLLLAQKNKRGLINSILSGLLVGCILNLIWSILDATCFYVFDYSLNNNIFEAYAIDNNIRFGTISLIVNGMIRASGFNYDPAHIGLIVPIVLSYSILKNKPWLTVVSLLAIVSSASTTALVCSVIVIVINISKIIKSWTIVKTIVLAIFILALVFVYFAFEGNILRTAIDKFFDRVIGTYGTSSSGGERWIYISGFFEAIKTSGLMCIFGTGFGTASYAYVFNGNLLQQLGMVNYFAYDVEMTYISYFFDVGILGVVLYLLILFRLLKGFRKGKTKGDNIIWAMTLGILLSALFYHYTLMSMQVILLIVGLVQLDSKKSATATTKALYKSNTLRKSEIKHSEC
ncbi:MAG: O-antigen ligase family protein [Clostridiales bacterium]|nr:O-antigen ligase family protein [Clostridiales bacterium]